MNSVETIEYGVRKNILIGAESYYIALPAQISNSGVTTDDRGRKIVKAGTPIVGDISKRDTAFTKTTGSDTPTAVLLHDVDVTDGNNNGTIILAACIDTLKLDSDVKALITDTVKTALPRIIFVEGSNV